MVISDFAIKRPIVTITVMIALVAFGLASLLNLQTDEFPTVSQPVVVVTIAYPGASPATVEREIIEPVEEGIFSISGLDAEKTTATATDGLAQFTAFFSFEKDLNQATQDIRDAISARRSDLPVEMKEPVLTRIDPGDFPVMQVALTSATLTPAELTRIADPTITRAIRAIPGVAQADVVGGVKRELTVELRPAALQAAGVSVADVVQALTSQNLAAPVGRITSGLSETAIRLEGRPQRPEDFAELVVTQRNGQPIRLGQLATVADGSQEPRTLAFFDAQQAVGIDIKKTREASTTDVSRRIHAAVDHIAATLPPGVHFSVVQDAGVRVQNAVTHVEEALIEGALLTVIVVFLFLNSWRSTVITGLALPVSVLASFIAVWAFGFTLNTMSLLGLSLSIGILIDDAIVVRENIVRHIELGADHYTAAFEGTDEIGLAVAATTFSIISVFVPVAFMYGIAGQWFKPFALTIACSVLVSLFVSFSLDPMLSAYWPDPELEAHQKGPITRVLERFNLWFNRQADRYQRVIAWALDHRLAMVGIALGTFVLAIVMIGSGHPGAGFTPDSDRSEIFLIVESPPGSSLDYTQRKVAEVVSVLRRHPEVAYVYSTLGTQVFLKAPSVTQAQLYVRLTPRASRSIAQKDLGSLFRREVSRLGGADVAVFTSGFGGAMKQIQLQLRGPDMATLTELAQRLEAEVRKVPGAVDVGLSVDGNKPELKVDLNRGLAGSLGITVGQVAQSLRPAFAGLHAGDWVDPSGETRDVEVRFAAASRERPADLANLPLVVGRGANGAPSTLPLGQIANIQLGFGPSQITHLDRQKVINIEGNAEGPLNGVMTAIQARLKTIPLPPGYDLSTGGEARDQNEVFTRIFTALFVAVLLMYLILVVQFGSFLDPLAILVSLPLSLIGVVLALAITGDTLNIMSLIGVILLMGIVAKNAILLIDFAKWSHEKGMPLREALIEAGRIRLRPILMTTFALVAGMMPVAIGHGEGADFQAPLGRAVIGGVITSTLLTLLVIPTVYEILDNAREWATSLFGRKPVGESAEPAHPVQHPAH
ncbi:MAG: efflux RND transporter permease subunit [Gemmatimonadales bacterium]